MNERSQKLLYMCSETEHFYTHTLSPSVQAPDGKYKRRSWPKLFKRRFLWSWYHVMQASKVTEVTMQIQQGLMNGTKQCLFNWIFNVMFSWSYKKKNGVCYKRISPGLCGFGLRKRMTQIEGFDVSVSHDVTTLWSYDHDLVMVYI